MQTKPSRTQVGLNSQSSEPTTAGDQRPVPLQQDPRQGKIRHPYELPPLQIGSPNSQSAELFGASPASPYSGRLREDHRLPIKGGVKPLGMDTATPTPTKATAGEQKAASQTGHSDELRRSMCQSPSWEAHDRRKKEKREEKKAGKEANVTTRRLKKAPPLDTFPVATSTPPRTQAPIPGKAEQHSPQCRDGLAQSQADACMTDSVYPGPRRQKQRRASVLGPSGPDESLIPGGLPTFPPARGRSSSFTSLFKTPFESGRRSSSCNASDSDSGFIGGIKLEQHRLDAHQKALNDIAIASSDIHPTSRKGKRAASPLRFFTPRSERKDAEKRLYPPIAIWTSGNKQALLAAEPSTVQESGAMNKWRHRVAFKPSAQKTTGKEGENSGGSGVKTGHKLTKSASSQREESFKNTLGNNGKPVIGASVVVHQIDGMIDFEKAGLHSALELDHSAHPALVDNAREGKKSVEEIGQDCERTEDGANSETNSQPSYRTAPSSPPPPPRRSSKRKSVISVGDGPVSTPPSHPHLMSELQDEARTTRRAELEPSASRLRVSSPPPPIDLQHQQRPASANAKAHPTFRSSRRPPSYPPSIPYETLDPTISKGKQPKRTLREAARAALGRSGLSPPSKHSAPPSKPLSRSNSPYSRGLGFSGGTPPVSTTNIPLASGPPSKSARVLGMQDWKTGRPASASPPTHSSEDSGSDEAQSVSGHGTPDTSRPQSGRFVSPTPGYHENEAKIDRNHSTYTPVLPSPAFSHVVDGPRANQPSAFELDPIQAAALKVMAAFPDVSRPNSSHRSRPTSSHRNSSDTNLPKQHRDRSKPRSMTTPAEPAADKKSMSPPLRDLIMFKEESSVAAPWPATYLEAARKAGPAALAVKSSKAPTSSPQTLAPATPLSPSLRPREQSSSSRSDLAVNAPGHQPQQDTRSTDGDGAIAKMFVECCQCKYYHDMPRKLYEAMANPEGALALGENAEFAGSLSMTIKCPWCKHDMSTKCCAGLAAMVHIKERLH